MTNILYEEGVGERVLLDSFCERGKGEGGLPFECFVAKLLSLGLPKLVLDTA